MSNILEDFTADLNGSGIYEESRDLVLGDRTLKDLLIIISGYIKNFDLSNATLFETSTRYTVMRYTPKDLYNDIEIIGNLSAYPEEITNLVIEHIPEGVFPKLRSYLADQLKREKQYVRNLSNYDFGSLAKRTDQSYLHNLVESFQKRNDPASIDHEVALLGTLKTATALADQLEKLKFMGVIEVKDKEGNSVDLLFLIEALAGIIALAREDINNDFEFRQLVNKLPNIWHIRDTVACDQELIVVARMQIMDYDQKDLNVLMQALKKLAEINFIFQTDKGPRPAWNILAQAETCINAQSLDDLIEASKLVTSLYGINSRIYESCAQKYLPQGRKSRLLAGLRDAFNFHGGLRGVQDLITFNGPTKIHGSTGPL